MKNILLLTNIYPMNDPAYKGTPVCHYFTREWMKMGYNVRVVHFMSLFPKPYYWVGRMFGEKIAAKTGFVTYSHPARTCQRYEVDGVPVLYVPVLKYVPHKNFAEHRVQEAFKHVCDSLAEEGFVPDAVTAHFPLPQLEMLFLFKQKFPAAKTCLVLHGDGSQIPVIYKEKYPQYMDAVEVWGFRSLAFKNQFEAVFGVKPHEFLCYSGIPEAYTESVERDFDQGIRKFVFVGSLFKLKNVEVTLKALHLAFPKHDFEFHVVGDGAEEASLCSLAEELKMQSQVVFHGRQKRENAQKIMAEADCFVMVSSREAFGLVYVEAMAKGCVAVATKGQGIDGVIVDGENGFLCESNNVEALAATLKKIRSLSAEQLRLISRKAVETACELTDAKVATHYLNQIL
ncbi:MAG: glycosyltransferase family 4 protein [Bacteroidales bacterium]|nr:glycosyltransferase family 4 protein [Bacteroidales bacterium]